MNPCVPVWQVVPAPPVVLGQVIHFYKPIFPIASTSNCIIYAIIKKCLRIPKG